MSFSTENNNSTEHSEFQDNLNLLRQIDFFSGLPLNFLKILAYLCNRETFKSEHYLFEQDEDDGQAFHIISGTVTLVYRDDEGEKDIKDFTGENFFGSLALLGNSPRLFSLKTKDDVVCLVMTRQKFSKALEQFPDIMPKIIRSIISKITAWERQFIVDHHGDWETHQDHIGLSLI